MNMPIRFLSDYLRKSILGTTDISEGRKLWVWMDLISVPQCYFGPFKDANEEAIEKSDGLFNENYIKWVGLQFGSIASNCKYFFYHIPIAFNTNAENLSVGLVDRYKSWGASLDWISLPNEFEKAGWQIWRMGRNVFGSLYINEEYSNRIWCIAEYVIRFLNRGSDSMLMGTNHWWVPLLDEFYDQTGSIVLRHSVMGTAALTSRLRCSGLDWINADIAERVKGWQEDRQGVLKTFLRPWGVIEFLGNVDAYRLEDVELVSRSLFNNLADIMGISCMPAGFCRFCAWVMSMGKQYERVRAPESQDVLLFSHRLRDFTPQDIIAILPDCIRDLSSILLLSGEDLSLLDRILLYSYGPSGPPSHTATANYPTHSFGRTALELLAATEVDGCKIFGAVSYDWGLDSVGLDSNPLVCRNRRDSNSLDPARLLHFVKTSPFIAVYDVVESSFVYDSNYGSLRMRLSKGRLVVDGQDATSKYSHHDAYDVIKRKTIQSFTFI